MDTLTIYHNPRCSKSRQTLELLKSKGYDPYVVEYLKSPPTIETLKALRVHFTMKDFVRTNESIFKESGLSLKNEEQVLQTMAKEPILMQRPIVTYKNKAAIGRPPEEVLKLFQ